MVEHTENQDDNIYSIEKNSDDSSNNREISSEIITNN